MYPPNMGGGFIHNQIKYIKSLGHEITTVVPSAYWPRMIPSGKRLSSYRMISKKCIIDNIPVYYPRYLRLPGKWFHPISCYTQYLSLMNFFTTLVKQFSPDIIYTHGATAPGYVGLMLSKKYKIPLVCALRGSDINLYPQYDWYSLRMTKKVISEADQIISVSYALKKTALTIAKPKKEIEIIYNGCDSNMFKFRTIDRIQIRSKFGIQEKEKVITFVGSVTQSKGISDLLSAFIKLNRRLKKNHLFIIGDFHRNNPVTSFKQHYIESAKIWQMGVLPSTEIVKHLNASDIFVLPSLSEGLPNAILEAMSCGLPVIATNVGGIPEAVTDGLNGFLINANDSDGLANAIHKVLTNDALARDMGQQGRAIIEKNFQWDSNAKKVVGLFDKLIPPDN